jgi:hypothetical protein
MPQNNHEIALETGNPGVGRVNFPTAARIAFDTATARMHGEGTGKGAGS